MKASAYYTLNSIGGNHDIKVLKRELDTLPGVLSVSVNDRTGRVAVDFDTTGESSDRIQQKIEELGFSVLDTRLDKLLM